MWQFRLVTDALEDQLVKKILPRYVSVAKNKSSANFQILKTTPAKFGGSTTNEELWELHNKLMENFYKIKNNIDNGKQKLGKTAKTSLLDLKILLVKNVMNSCELCERKCGANRWEGELGICKVGSRCLISSEFIHMGEESHITPSHTIFFMGCPFKCQFCQNWTISQWYESGTETNGKELAKTIEKRRLEGARNVNFVGGEPTPNTSWILESLKYCTVNVPVIWNSDMYMSEKTMRILNGVVDMYLSDFKYGNNTCASRLSKVTRYFEICTRNHLLAAKQAEVTLRHLILPNHLECCTKPVLKWIADNIRMKCIVNIMDQYRPCWRASEYPEINRRITTEEFEEAINYAKRLKLNFIM